MNETLVHGHSNAKEQLKPKKSIDAYSYHDNYNLCQSRPSPNHVFTQYLTFIKSHQEIRRQSIGEKKLPPHEETSIIYHHKIPQV